MEGFSRDLRIGIRALRAAPVVTIVATLSIALGIGANTAIFSLIDSLILRSLPVTDPDRLALVTTTTPGIRAWSYPVWKELERSQIFERASAWSLSRRNLASGGETQFVDGLWASGSFFETLQVGARLGRVFGPADDRAGGGPDGPVVVIGDRFWQRHFGGAPDVIGRTLTLDDVPYTIIGVTPPSFFGMEVGRSFDIALPLEYNQGSRGATTTWLTVVGRLASGQTSEAATTILRGIQPRIRAATLPSSATAAYRATYLQAPFALSPAATGSSLLRRQYQRPLVTIMVVVALVLLVACANIANLLLARAAARRHEFSVRQALGASRWQLARPVLVESVLLAVIGTVLGVMVGLWGSRALVRELAKQTTTQSITMFLDLSLNAHVLTFAIGATLVSVLLFGLAPALRSSAQTSDALKEGRTTVGDDRIGLSHSLVVAQFTLSLVLVVGAGLFVRTFTSLAAVPLGFDPGRVLVVSVGAQRAPIDPARRVPIFERATEAVRDVPGVVEVAASLMTPISGLGLTNTIEVAGVPPPPDGERSASINHVSPGYFRALGTSLRAGRDFTSGDGPGSSPVAIVNETFVRRFLEGANPIGQAIAGLPPAPDVPIVGVVADSVYRSLRDPVPPTVFLPFAQSREAGAFAMMSLSIRADRLPESLIRSVSETLSRVNPDLTWTFRPLDEQIAASITQERMTASLAAFFGGLALVLAAVGLYGVTAYSVSRRRAEIGIRIALGADATRVVRLVMLRVTALVGVGAVLGAVASLWLSQFVTPLLYGLDSKDPATIATAVGVLVSIGLIAGLLPALTAARIDPAALLRES